MVVAGRQGGRVHICSDSGGDLFFFITEDAYFFHIRQKPNAEAFSFRKNQLKMQTFKV